MITVTNDIFTIKAGNFIGLSVGCRWTNSEIPATGTQHVITSDGGGEQLYYELKR